MPEPSSEDEPALPEDSWMVRPCQIYREEYDECGTVGGRLHQRYVYGYTLDCNKWMDDYKNCMKYVKTKDPQHLLPIIEQEKERRENRLRGARSNTVWKYRDSAPPGWSEELPDQLKNNNNNSLLIQHEQKIISSDSKKTDNRTLCTIL